MRLGQSNLISAIANCQAVVMFSDPQVAACVALWQLKLHSATPKPIFGGGARGRGSRGGRGGTGANRWLLY